MIGANCSKFDRSSSRRRSGVTIFKVPQGDDKWSFKWRKSVFTKDRVIDKALRKRIMKKNYVCERHYFEDQDIRCMCKTISFLFLQSIL